MKLLYSVDTIPKFIKKSAVTIGNFDGVHQGHQALLIQLKKQAARLNLPAVVILFEPQPQEYFLANSTKTLIQTNSPARLMTLREKINCFNSLNIDYVVCIRFNKQIAQMSYQQFAKTYFFNLLRAQFILLGNDFRFGKNRLGNSDSLKNLSEAQYCKIEIFNDFMLNEQRVSSTVIRHLLATANFPQAQWLLGRPYSICGRVIKGAALGRKWGVPTANISRSLTNPPFTGVFCVTIRRENDKLYFGIANLGYRPTINGTQPILEVHFLQGSYHLYGERLQIFFEHKIRDEIKFSSLDALIDQIYKDIRTAKRYFKLT